MSPVPTLTGFGLFQSARHLTDTVADYFVNEGSGSVRQVYKWFQSLALAEEKPLNTTLKDITAACILLSTEFSLQEPPLLVQTRPGFFSLQNVDAW
jgi:hypothetical protein